MAYSRANGEQSSDHRIICSAMVNLAVKLGVSKVKFGASGLCKRIKKGLSD
jgi:hypothetical protein